MNLQTIAENAFFNVMVGVIGIVSFVIGIVSLVIAIRQSNNKRIVYSYSTVNLIGKSQTAIENLSVKYKNEEIHDLSRTVVSFWNDGRGAVSKDDIAEGSDLIIKCCNEARILDVSVIERTDDRNLVRIGDFDQSKIPIIFDHLDSKDGANIQVIHTGDKITLDFLGKLRGGDKKILHVEDRPQEQYISAVLIFLIPSVIAVLAALMFLEIPDWYYNFTGKEFKFFSPEQVAYITPFVLLWVQSIVKKIVTESMTKKPKELR